MSNEELVIKIKAGIDVAENMEALYRQMKAFIHTIAWKYRGYEALEDLEQEGFLALYPAIDGYRPEEGVAFVHYAAFWIKQKITRYIHNNGMIRIPVKQRLRINQYERIRTTFLSTMGREPTNKEISWYMEISPKQVEQLKRDEIAAKVGSLDCFVAGEEDITIGDLVAAKDDVEQAVLDAVEAEQLKDVLWSMVDKLPERQSQIIQSKYQEGKTAKEIGKTWDISGERVRQLESAAVRELRKPSKTKRLEPFVTEYIETHAYGGGSEAFQRTWTSATEYTAMRLLEMKKGRLGEQERRLSIQEQQKGLATA